MKKVILTIGFLFAFILTNAQVVRYVKSGASGNGTSWVNASGDLQAMINASVAGDEVWVAQGVYQRPAGQFFSMKEGVKILGGFPSDNNNANLTHRNWNAYPTTLLGGNGRSVIRNVFTATNKMTNASVLDGFIVTGNNVTVSEYGAGIFNKYASPVISNVIFKENKASHNGGAMCNENSNPKIINSLFYLNSANHGAGVANLLSSNSEYINVTFVKNYSPYSVIRNHGNSTSVLKNTLMYDNYANASSKIVKTIQNNDTSTSEFYHSYIQNTTTNDSNGNINGSQVLEFVNSAANDFRVVPNSLTIDTGNNSYLSDITTDLNGNDRFFGGTIDIGAFEYQGEGCIGVATWNGTAWDTTPKPFMSLVVNGNLTISSDLQACDMTVNSGNVLLASNKTLLLENELVINGGTFKILDQGSLVQVNPEAINVGQITVEEKTKLMNEGNYGYWSSPVSGQTLKSFSPLTADPYFYSWDAPTQLWIQEFGGNILMEPANGYIVRAPLGNEIVSRTLNYKGIPNNGNYSIDVIGGGVFNFMGNPYPSAIDIDAFLADSDNNELQKVVYLWSNGYEIVNNNYVFLLSGFAIYNGYGYVGSSPTSQVPTNMIATGQAMFLMASSDGEVVFKNEHRVSGNNNLSFNKNLKKDRYWVNMMNDVAYGQVLVGYDMNATNDFDLDFDAKFLEAETPIQLYTVSSDERLAIEVKSLFNQEDIVELGYIVKKPGTYKINLPNAEGDFKNSQEVFLKDKYLNIVVSLNQGEYTFVTEEGTFNDRFELVYKNNSELKDSSNNSSWIVYTKNNLTIIEATFEFNNVEVYDLSGRLIYESIDNNSNVHKIESLDSNQVYIVKIYTNTGSLVRKFRS